MRKIHQQIETQKHAINDRKRSINRDYKVIKNKASNLSLTALGFFAAGFILLPRKMRLLRLAFKTFTVLTTARQFLELLPHSGEIEEKGNLQTRRRRS